jgi:peptidoglycan/xylan/chitin deacetylase (PgdA/CDA1 family)
MRILHLLSQTQLTGAEVYTQTLVDLQNRAGHQVFVISDKIHVKLPIPFTSLGLSTSRFSDRMKNIWQLRAYLKKNQIEVIHCHSRGAVRHAFWARLGLPVAMVTTLHGRQHFSWSKRWLNIYGEILIAICENVKAAMIHDFKMPGSHIRVLRNPISTKLLETPKPPPAKSISIALIGRSSGPKGQRFEKIALYSFEKWLKSDPELKIELSIIAPHPENFSAELRQHLKVLMENFPNQIFLRGAIANLIHELPRFDLVLASGRIAMECLFLQIPVLAIGEYTSHGLINSMNWASALASNFGDIGAETLEKPLDLNSIHEEVLSFIQNPRSRPSPETLKTLQDLAVQEFAADGIFDKITEAYRAAIFKRYVPSWIPILMYHKVPTRALASRHRIFVTTERFRRHLNFFKKRGFTTLTFQDLNQFWSGKRNLKEFPRKPLILTFDDGYRDNLNNAQPLLEEFHFRAVIFLLANHSILENTWDVSTGEKPEALMDLQEKMQLDPKVWEVGSHGFNHLHLPELSQDLALREMLESKRTLQLDLKQPIYSFAYPFGSTNEQLPKLAVEAGYKFAVNTDQGGLHLADQPLSLFRVNVFPEDGPFELWKKTSPWYRKYFYRKRGR